MSKIEKNIVSQLNKIEKTIEVVIKNKKILATMCFLQQKNAIS